MLERDLFKVPLTLTLLRVVLDLGELDAAQPSPLSVSLSELATQGDVWDEALRGHTAYLTNEWQALRQEVTTTVAQMQRLSAAGHDSRFDVHFGTPVDTIVRAAHNGDYQALLMATHGRTGLRRMVLGSVTEQVLRRVQIPVMVLRPTEKNTA